MDMFTIINMIIITVVANIIIVIIVLANYT